MLSIILNENQVGLNLFPKYWI